jgi:hypothetical protein
LPSSIAQVEIDLPFVFADTEIDQTRRAFVMCLGFEHAQSGLHSLRIGSASGLLEEAPRHPSLEPFRSYRPGFAMPVNGDVRMAAAVPVVEQLGRARSKAY